MELSVDRRRGSPRTKTPCGACDMMRTAVCVNDVVDRVKWRTDRPQNSWENKTKKIVAGIGGTCPRTTVCTSPIGSFFGATSRPRTNTRVSTLTPPRPSRTGHPFPFCVFLFVPRPPIRYAHVLRRILSFESRVVSGRQCVCARARVSRVDSEDDKRRNRKYLCRASSTFYVEYFLEMGETFACVYRLSYGNRTRARQLSFAPVQRVLFARVHRESLSWIGKIPAVRARHSRRAANPIRRRTTYCVLRDPLE